MNQKLKNVFLPLLACLFLLPWALYKCERNKNSGLKYENTKLQANVAAMADTVRITKTKNDELEFNRKSFITDRISELEAINKDLADEVKKTKGKPVFIAKAGATITIHDTIPAIVMSGSCDSGFVAGIDIDTVYSPGNTRKLQGIIAVSGTDAHVDLKEQLGVSVVTGLKKTDAGDYEIFFRSLYPNLTITSLQGSYIPKNQIERPVKKKHFGFGLQLGYSPITYLIDYKKFTLINQVTLGAGIHYNF